MIFQTGFRMHPTAMNQQELTTSDKLSIRILIPAFNEESSIAKVIHALPAHLDEIIVINNGSTDRTLEKAKAAGATVLHEPRRGYGYACLKGIHYVQLHFPNTDIIVFMDGDFSDDANDLPDLLHPILHHACDFVIGARVSSLRQPNSMTVPQIFGNWLATSLMRVLMHSPFTDLGPFRAIKLDKLIALNMQDKTYGWTVEMQLKALRHRLNIQEVPVHYRPRIGKSKVSGTIKGVILAGIKIIYWILKYYFRK